MAAGSRSAGALALLVLLACSGFTSATVEEGSVLAVAKAAGATAFVAAVEAAGLTSVLGKADFVATVFVPTNAALAAAGNVPPAILPSILRYHVVPTRRISFRRLVVSGRLFTDLRPKFLRAGLTLKLAVRIVGETNNVGVVHPDLRTKKGVIHIVDGVLVPKLPAPAPPPPSPKPSSCASVLDLVLATPHLSTLAELATKAGLAGALADKTLQGTIVAPTNAAFTKVPGFIAASTDLLKQTLLYHVIKGAGKPAAEVIRTAGTPFPTLADVGGPLKFAVNNGVVSVAGLTNAAVVVKTDILACAGTVVHIIDAVLIPYYSPPPPPPPPPPPAPVAACASVLDLVLATPELSTLAQLATKAGLTSALADKGLQATIVAPTNDAFTRVPSFVANNLEALTQTLLYHVIPGAGKPAAEVIRTAGTPFPTAAKIGGPLTFKTLGSKVVVVGATNSAIVVRTDFLACGGTVVHIISEVLIPSKTYYYG